MKLNRITYAAFFIALIGCAEGSSDGVKTSAPLRALRRAYDGAPPTIPHDRIGATCTECHNEDGLQVEGLGFAPASPHEATRGLSAMSRCEQCHVYKKEDELFAENSFQGLQQDLRHGLRLHALAPPVVPHPYFMRENCKACHTGEAAREEIRCSHPERIRCQQCHLHISTAVDSTAMK